MVQYFVGTRVAAFALMAMLTAACGDSSVAPGNDATMGGASFARNKNEGPGTPNENKSCDQTGGKRTSGTKRDKNACEGGGSSASFTLVFTPGSAVFDFGAEYLRASDCTLETEQGGVNLINETTPICVPEEGDNIEIYLYEWITPYPYALSVSDGGGSCTGNVCRITGTGAIVTVTLTDG